jgi:hypothetical protein
MKLTATQHPGVDLLDDGQEFEELKQFWESEEGLKMQEAAHYEVPTLGFHRRGR